MLYTYTLVCDNYATNPISAPFVVIVEATTYKNALKKAARAILRRCPDEYETDEYETEDTFWDREGSPVVLTALYGDHTHDLVDRATYAVIQA